MWFKPVSGPNRLPLSVCGLNGLSVCGPNRQPACGPNRLSLSVCGPDNYCLSMVQIIIVCLWSKQITIVCLWLKRIIIICLWSKLTDYHCLSVVQTDYHLSVCGPSRLPLSVCNPKRLSSLSVFQVPAEHKQSRLCGSASHLHDQHRRPGQGDLPERPRAAVVHRRKGGNCFPCHRHSGAAPSAAVRTVRHRTQLSALGVGTCRMTVVN